MSIGATATVCPFAENPHRLFYTLRHPPGEIEMGLLKDNISKFVDSFENN